MKERHSTILAFVAGVAITLTAVFLVQTIRDELGSPAGNSSRARRDAPSASVGKPADDTKVKALRSTLYSDAKTKAHQHNRDRRKTWSENTNEFSILTPAEKKLTLGHSLGGAPKDAPVLKPLSMYKAPLGAGSGSRRLPDSVDHRDRGIITPPKNQGYCGSCWAVAATQQIESYWAIAYGKEQLTTLASQQIVSCAEVLGARPWSWMAPLNGSGCFGGLIESAYDYVARFGFIMAENAFPYVSGLPWRFPEGIQGSVQNGICQGPFSTWPGPSSHDLEIAGPAAAMHDWTLTSLSFGAAISGYVQLERNSPLATMTALHEIGPLSVVVDAMTWHPYQSGVFDGCENTALMPNHAVQLVGYGRDPDLKQDFWLVRNSWGVMWGEGGYIRLRRGGDENECTKCVDLRPWFSDEEGGACVDVCGTCGLLVRPSYPVVSDLPMPSFDPDDAHRRR